MTFIQTIEMRTSNFDEIAKLEEEWRRATEGKRTLRRAIVVRDRADARRHVVIAFFDDYDSAMVNSNLPQTGAFGEKQAAFVEGPMVFTDYDVVEDRD